MTPDDGRTIYEGQDGYALVDKQQYDRLLTEQRTHWHSCEACRERWPCLTIGDCPLSSRAGLCRDCLQRTIEILVDLLRRGYIHNSYPNCGYEQMTSAEKAMFDMVTAGYKGGESCDAETS